MIWCKQPFNGRTRPDCAAGAVLIREAEHMIAASFDSGSVRFTSPEYVTRHQHMRFAEVDHTFECNSLLVWVSDVPACIIADIDLLEISV